jgi:hypothetical protein
MDRGEVYTKKLHSEKSEVDFEKRTFSQSLVPSSQRQMNKLNEKRRRQQQEEKRTEEAGFILGLET